MSSQTQAISLTLPDRFTVATRSWRAGLRTRHASHDRFAGETLCPAPAVPLTFSRLAPITRSGEQATFPRAEYGASVLHLAGRWHGLVSFTASDDGIVWQPVALTAFTTGAAETTTTKPGMWRTPPGFGGRVLRIQVHTLVAGTIIGAFGTAPWPGAHDILLSHAA